MRIVLVVGRICLLDCNLFEPVDQHDDEDDTVITAAAATEIPFGFTPPGQDDEAVPDEW